MSTSLVSICRCSSFAQLMSTAFLVGIVWLVGDSVQAGTPPTVSRPMAHPPIAPLHIQTTQVANRPTPIAVPTAGSHSEPNRHHFPHSGSGNWGGGGYGFGSGGLGVGFGFGYAPPSVIVVGPGNGFGGGPIPGPVFTGNPSGGGLMLPQPFPVDPTGFQTRPTVPRPEPAKADGLVTIGDRLFRAGNLRKAEERYGQARRANPKSATPYIRLAQLSLVRGDYALAADQIRAAMTAEPGWLVNAVDIQSVYAEPGDFAKVVAKLESHLQKTPSDRNGWLVLGTELYLAGKTRQAADIFMRLNDRKPDQTLAAFLDATTPDPPPKP